MLSAIERRRAGRGLQVARTIDEGPRVLIFPAFGDRYLSTNLLRGLAERGA